MSRPGDTAKVAYPDPFKLLVFILRESRYSAVDKTAYLGYILLLITVGFSISGLALLFLTGSPDAETDREVSQAYGTFSGILLIGLPAAFIFTKVTYTRYASVYIALENRRRKKANGA